jgi:transglutaminase superfamily protein
MRTPPAPGRLFALRVLLFAAVVPLLLRLRIDRLAPLLEPRQPPIPPAANDATAAIIALIARIDRLLLAGRPFVRSGCLTRGITLYYFLRRAGADVALCFGIGGIGEVDGGFSGHCWLSHSGAPLAEKRDPRSLFTEMFRLPPAATPGAGRLAEAGSPWRP